MTYKPLEFGEGFLAGWGLKYIWKAAALQMSDPSTLGYGVKIFQITKPSAGINEVWFGADDLVECIIAALIILAGKGRSDISFFGMGMLTGILSVKAYEIIQKNP